MQTQPNAAYKTKNITLTYFLAFLLCTCDLNPNMKDCTLVVGHPKYNNIKSQIPLSEIESIKCCIDLSKY